MMLNLPNLKPLYDLVAVIEFDADPSSATPFANRVGGAAAAESIEHEIARPCRHLHNPIENFRRESIGPTLAALELPVPDRRDVCPHVLQIDAERIHGTSVAAIVPDLTAAMPTCLDRGPNLAERLRLSLGEIEQAVMCGV